MNDIASARRLICRIDSQNWWIDAAVWRFSLTLFLPVFVVFNLLWEFAQLPLYTLWSEATPTYIAYAVLHCTVGDLLVGAGALFMALIATRARVLSEWNWIRIGFVTVILGFAYTAYSEWMNTAVLGTWTYSEWMPVLPLVPVGLSPLLQWLIVPSVALVLSRRLAIAKQAQRATNSR